MAQETGSSAAVASGTTTPAVAAAPAPAALAVVPDSTDRLLVSLEHLDVVHVGLPILDEAAVVARHHPVVVVRPNHGPDGNVVGLSSVGKRREERLSTTKPWEQNRNSTQPYL